MRRESINKATAEETKNPVANGINSYGHGRLNVLYNIFSIFVRALTLTNRENREDSDEYLGETDRWDKCGHVSADGACPSQTQGANVEH